MWRMERVNNWAETVPIYNGSNQRFVRDWNHFYVLSRFFVFSHDANSF